MRAPAAGLAALIGFAVAGLPGPASADAFMAIPVPAVTVQAGDTIRPETLAERRYRVTYVERSAFVRDAGEAVGLAARRTLPKGRPIALADLGAPFAVREGDMVSAEFAAGALRI
jgi:flagellar basal body P-ring formation protein FlgA